MYANAEGSKERQELAITSAHASSSLADVDKYGPDKAFGDDPSTSWTEGRVDAGVGEFLEIALNQPVKIDAIEIMPGRFVPGLTLVKGNSIL